MFFDVVVVSSSSSSSNGCFSKWLKTIHFYVVINSLSTNIYSPLIQLDTVTALCVLYAVCKVTLHTAYSTHHHKARNWQCKNPDSNWSGPGFKLQNPVTICLTWNNVHTVDPKLLRSTLQNLRIFIQDFDFSGHSFSSDYPTRKSYLNLIFRAHQ